MGKTLRVLKLAVIRNPNALGGFSFHRSSEFVFPYGCLENSDLENPDPRPEKLRPLGVSKTQTQKLRPSGVSKTQTLWVSRKLRLENSTVVYIFLFVIV